MVDEQPIPPPETAPSSTTEPAPVAARDTAASGSAAGGQVEPAPASALDRPRAAAEGPAAAAPGCAGPAEPGTPDLAAEPANEPAPSARPEAAEPTASNGVLAGEPTPARPMPPLDFAPAVDTSPAREPADVLEELTFPPSVQASE